MKFLALAAIYNHKQEWIETLVQSMIDQDHADDIHIIVIDDRANGFPAQSFQALSPLGHRRTITVVRMAERAENLLAKYQQGLSYAEVIGIKFDAVCVVDDDDIYLHDHISQHAKVLRDKLWSYPDKVFSTYMHTFRVEGSGGRFWASSAYRRTALSKIGDYSNVHEKIAEAAYDQAFLHRMHQAHGEAGHQANPTYVYMWDMTQDNHVSGHIENGVYRFDQIPESPTTGPLVPRYSETAGMVYEMARPFRG